MDCVANQFSSPRFAINVACSSADRVSDMCLRRILQPHEPLECAHGRARSSDMVHVDNCANPTVAYPGQVTSTNVLVRQSSRSTLTKAQRFRLYANSRPCEAKELALRQVHHVSCRQTFPGETHSCRLSFSMENWLRAVAMKNRLLPRRDATSASVRTSEPTRGS